jgi:hypothetical protein
MPVWGDVFLDKANTNIQAKVPLDPSKAGALIMSWDLVRASVLALLQRRHPY